MRDALSVPPICSPYPRTFKAWPQTLRRQLWNWQGIADVSPRLLEHSGRRQQRVVAMRSTNELQADREAARGNAAGHRDSGAARQADHERQKHPVDVRLKFLSGNLGRKSLLNREGINGDGWAARTSTGL